MFVNACERLSGGKAILAILLILPVHALENGLCRTPPMGWNHWSSMRGYVTVDTARSTADTMESMGFKKAGYIYLNNDAGDGVRTADFSSLAPEFHSRGFKYGYYGWTGSGTGRETTFANRWASMGVDYIKYDYFNYSSSHSTFVAMRDALAATGRPILYSAHAAEEHVTAALTEVANMWRTGPDIYIPWEQPSWQKVLWNTDLNTRYAQFAKPGCFNDPDFLLVGLCDGWAVNANGDYGFTTEQDRTQFNLWCIMAAPLIIGSDICKLKRKSIEILTNSEVIAVNQDSLGYQGRPVYKNTAGQYEIWSKNLRNGDRAIMVFNRSAVVKTVTLRWRDAGLGGVQTVRDLWAHADLGAVSDSMVISGMPPWGSAMYRVTGQPLGVRYDIVARPSHEGYRIGLTNSRFPHASVQGLIAGHPAFDLMGKRVGAGTAGRLCIMDHQFESVSW